MNDIKLSEHFRLSEFTRSATARRLGIKNEVSSQQLSNLMLLCRYVLEPLRKRFGQPIYVNSGYRSQELNRAVGGAVKSFHIYGRAADIRAANLSDNNTLYALIKELRLPVHELLKEQVIKGIPTWIHVAI
jgi:uncharacterized protein YcbK (DUF882 family)